MSKVKIPKDYKDRLKDVAAKHNFASAQAFADHLVEKGLKAYGATAGSLSAQMDQIVDDKGYSSHEELLEHLLERGLRAYEEPESDPAKLEARLRGLGYIE